jgi:threonine dehydrogenase-like Zn-dependent dehydrogenase
MSALLTAIVSLLFVGWPAATGHVLPAEVVHVEGRGPIALAAFECVSIGRSATVTRVCRDADGRRAIAEIDGRHRAYCDLPAGLIDAWLGARSMGRFHAAHLAGRHDCG